MRIVLYGPTGAGKSTLAAAFARIYKCHIASTGEFIRREFPNDPLTGGFSDREKQIAEYIEQQLKWENVVLDGYPRHSAQLEQLLALGREKGYEFAHVFLTASERTARHRILLRGRADAKKFADQYWGQQEALEKLATKLCSYHEPHMGFGESWSPDEAARSIWRSFGGAE